MEVNYLKCDNIQTVIPIELKFAMYYVGFLLCIVLIFFNIGKWYFDKRKSDSSYTLQPMELNYLICNSIQTLKPFELKFATYDVRYFVIDCTDFGEQRFNGISTREKG